MELGELIAALEAEDPARVLPLGFGKPHSYRGYYEQLAFEPTADVMIGDMLEAAKSALGATYEGWKGGDFTMHERTDCWLAEEGHSGGEEIGPILLALMLTADQLGGESKTSLHRFTPRCGSFLGRTDGGGYLYCRRERYHDPAAECSAAPDA
jgi:hypothetical protein